jgi:hypothetical protein
VTDIQGDEKKKNPKWPTQKNEFFKMFMKISCIGSWVGRID